MRIMVERMREWVDAVRGDIIDWAEGLELT